LGEDSSEDICRPNTVANADPVAGRLTEENEDIDTAEKVNACVTLPARMLNDTTTCTSTPRPRSNLAVTELSAFHLEDSAEVKPNRTPPDMPTAPLWLV